MNVIKNAKAALVAIAIMAAPFALPVQATPIMVTIGLATGNITGGPYATVTLDDFGTTGTVHVTLTPLPGFGIIDTGAGDPLMFNIFGDPALCQQGVAGCSTNNIQNLTAGFTFNPTNTGNQDGTGSWFYSIQCAVCGNGGSSGGFTGTMSFDLVLAGVNDASFISTAASNGYRFGSDICVQSSSGTGCSATGDAVNSSSSTSTSTSTGGGGGSSGGSVPEPSSSALALLGVALLAGTFIKRKKSQRA